MASLCHENVTHQDQSPFRRALHSLRWRKRVSSGVGGCLVQQWGFWIHTKREQEQEQMWQALSTAARSVFVGEGLLAGGV